MQDCWCIVELLGHVRVAGKVSEVELFGTKMGRVDIPAGEEFTTQFFSGGSVYRITPCGEAEARLVAAANLPKPVHPWETRKFASLPTNNPDGGPNIEDGDDNYF